jgi:hypothetical protein
MLDCDPRRLAAARAKLFSLKGAPGAMWAIVAGAAIATALMALVRVHISSHLGNADDYSFAAVVARH